MKKFIFFRSDRLGDFIILTNILKAIKEKYKDSQITVLCSPTNYNFIRKYKIIDRIFVYNKTASVFNKIVILKKILSTNYFASFAVDGKSFSNLCNFLIKSKYKIGLVYKYKFLNFWFHKPNIFYNLLIFNKFETFTSKKNLQKVEHLPSKFLSLGNFLGLKIKTSDSYYFETSKKENLKFKKFKQENLAKKYFLIHLDEKWNDIASIDDKLFLNFLYLQRNTKTQLVITSFKNNFNYFKNLKRNISHNRFVKNILMIENSNLYFFERLIRHSLCSVSCHSGFLVQIAGSNGTNLVDIINRKDQKWYSCWKPKNTKHKFIYKSNKHKVPIDFIFKNLTHALKLYL